MHCSNSCSVATVAQVCNIVKPVWKESCKILVKTSSTLCPTQTAVQQKETNNCKRQLITNLTCSNVMTDGAALTMVSYTMALSKLYRQDVPLLPDNVCPYEVHICEVTCLESMQNVIQELLKIQETTANCQHFPIFRFGTAPSHREWRMRTLNARHQRMCYWSVAVAGIIRLLNGILWSSPARAPEIPRCPRAVFGYLHHVSAALHTRQHTPLHCC